MNATQKIGKSCRNDWVVAVSGANALNMYHISQLNWESNQKGGIGKKETEIPKWSHLC